MMKTVNTTDDEILNNIQNMVLSKNDDMHIQKELSNYEKIKYLMNTLVNLEIKNMKNVDIRVSHGWGDKNNDMGGGIGGGIMKLICYGSNDCYLTDVEECIADHKFKYYKRIYCDILVNLLRQYDNKLNEKEIHFILMKYLKEIVMKINIKEYIIQKIIENVLTSQIYLNDILNEILRHDNEIIKYEIMEVLINKIEYVNFVDKYGILLYAHNEIKKNRKEKYKIPLELIKKYKDKLKMVDETLNESVFSTMLNESVFSKICSYDEQPQNTELGLYMLNNHFDKCVNKKFTLYEMLTKAFNKRNIEIAKRLIELSSDDEIIKALKTVKNKNTETLLMASSCDIEIFNNFINKYEYNCNIKFQLNSGETALYFLVNRTCHSTTNQSIIMNIINKYGFDCGINGSNEYNSVFRILIENKYDQNFLVNVINKFGYMILPFFIPQGYASYVEKEHTLVYLMKNRFDDAVCCYLDKFKNKIDFNMQYYLEPFRKCNCCIENKHKLPKQSEQTHFTLLELATRFDLKKSHIKISAYK